MTNRPIYQTTRDLSNENKIKAIIEPKWRCELKKLPFAYHVDWMAMRANSPLAFIEIKWRENLSISKYPEYMLSLNKWMMGKEYTNETKIPFILIVHFTEGTYYVKQDNLEVRYGFGGRYDRGDSQDVEPMVFIPIGAFVLV